MIGWSKNNEVKETLEVSIEEGKEAINGWRLDEKFQKWRKMMRNPLRNAEVVYNTSLNILNKDIERKGGKDV